MPTMCMVVAPSPTNPIFMRFKWGGGHTYGRECLTIVIVTLVRMFVIGTVARG